MHMSNIFFYCRRQIFFGNFTHPKYATRVPRKAWCMHAYNTARIIGLLAPPMTLEDLLVGMVGSRQPKRPEERSLNTFVLVQTYVLKAMTGLGYLALTWSTVVLLGGFVTALGKYDFWSLTVISLLQAARSVISPRLCIASIWEII